MRAPAFGDVLQTLVLLAYVIAVNAMVGGSLLAAHSYVHRGDMHAALIARFRRAFPSLVFAAIALGTAASLIVHARHGGAGLMLPGRGDRAAVARAVHLGLAACAVAGVLFANAASAVDPTRVVFRRWLARHGAFWATLCTLANMLAGVVWMAALPRDTVIRFTGADTGLMITFAWALVAAILALGFIAMSLTVTDPRAYLRAGTVALGITLVGMVRMREALRPSLPVQALDAPTVIGACVLVVAGGVLLSRAWRSFGDARATRSVERGARN